MPKKDPRVDVYIAEAAPFARPILKHLRQIVHRACPETEETVKWSMPHFEHKGIMCGMAAFKAHCAFSFWKASLIFPTDPKKLEAAMGQFGCIKSLDDLPADNVLSGYVKKAAALNDAGIKDPKKEKKPPAALHIPDYLTDALRRNGKARETFEKLSHSCRKEYVQWLTEAKREETREGRLATTLEWLTEGKSRNWKYQEC